MDCPNFDPAQWVRSALDLGAKYIVFVAKHGAGICRWQSEYGGLSFKYSPYKNGKGDPLGELAEECRKHNIKLGIYLSGTSQTFGACDSGITKNPEEQEAYNDIYRGWLTEVLSKYGEIIEVWFDGSISIAVGDILKKYAPNAIVFQSKYANIRWVGQEEGYASDPAWCTVSRYDAVTGISTQAQGDPDGDVWMPYECDARLRDEWGYNMSPSNKLHSLDTLMDMYYNSVGHGANLLINHAPNASGRIEDEDFARMKEFGEEIRRRFSNPIAKTSGEGDCVELNLGCKTPIDHVITMEDISGGHRVRSYIIEGFDGSSWKKLISGTAIGHKKIDYFASTEVEKIRIRVTSHVGEPLIRSFAAFNVGTTPKLPEKTQYDEIKLGEYGTEIFDVESNVAEFKFDLEPYIDAAGQYKLSFRDKDNFSKIKIDKAWLEIGGVICDEYLKKPDDSVNDFDIFMPGIDQKVTFRAVTARRNGSIKGEVMFCRMA